MVFIKQNRINAKHPDGADCLIPLVMADSYLEITKTGNHVRFKTDDATLTYPLDAYRALVKKQNCFCIAGICQ